MTTIITTLSGTQYVIHGGCVTRYGSTACVDYDGVPCDRTIAGEALLLESVPTVGRSWHFRTPAGRVDTTAVTRITVR